MCHILDNGDIMPKCRYILFAYITVSTDVRLYKLICLHCTILDGSDDTWVILSYCVLNLCVCLYDS